VTPGMTHDGDLHGTQNTGSCSVQAQSRTLLHAGELRGRCDSGKTVRHVQRTLLFGSWQQTTDCYLRGETIKCNGLLIMASH